MTSNQLCGGGNLFYILPHVSEIETSNTQMSSCWRHEVAFLLLLQMIRLPSAAWVGWLWPPVAGSSDACHQQLVSGRVDGSGVCFGSEEVKCKLLFRVRLNICRSSILGGGGQSGGESP